MAKLKLVPQRLCLDGCGEPVTGKANFKPGHDAKLHSLWLKVIKGEAKPNTLPKAGAAYAKDHWGDRKPPKPPKAKKVA